MFYADFITFRVRRSRSEMYSDYCRLCVCVRVCLSVCLSVCVPVARHNATLLHGPGCKLGEW